MLHADRQSCIRVREFFNGQPDVGTVLSVLRPNFACGIHLFDVQTFGESSIPYFEGQPTLKSVIQSTALSDKMASLVTSLFHVSSLQLSLYDIYCAIECYQAQIAKLKATHSQVNQMIL